MASICEEQNKTAEGVKGRKEQNHFYVTGGSGGEEESNRTGNELKTGISSLINTLPWDMGGKAGQANKHPSQLPTATASRSLRLAIQPHTLSLAFLAVCQPILTVLLTLLLCCILHSGTLCNKLFPPCLSSLATCLYTTFLPLASMVFVVAGGGIGGGSLSGVDDLMMGDGQDRWLQIKRTG